MDMSPDTLTTWDPSLHLNTLVYDTAVSRETVHVLSEMGAIGTEVLRVRRLLEQLHNLYVPLLVGHL